MNKTVIASLVKPPEDTSSSESEAKIEAAEEFILTISLQKKTITDEINAKITSKTRTLKDITIV
jgi:hypothetical protein